MEKGTKKTFAPMSEREEMTAREIVDAAFQVHAALGPGLLEQVYEACLYDELVERGHVVVRQAVVPIMYRGRVLDDGLRLDLLVNDCVIVELKAVNEIIPVYDAQLLTYMKLTGKRLGLLINFNVTLIKNGIKRKVI